MVNRSTYRLLFSSGILRSIKWQFSDKILKLFGSVFVGMLMGRYLGPDQFGLLNFVYAFVWMFATIGTLGLDEVIIKELIEYPEQREKILGTSLVLKLFGAFLSILCILIFTFIFNDDFENKTWLVVFTVASMVVRNFSVVKLWYESQLQSKKIMVIDNAAYAVGLILKLIFIFTKQPVTYFAFTAFAEFTLSTSLFYFSYRRKGGKTTFPVYDKELGKKLLHQSWPLIIIGLSIMLYTRSDQVMLTLLSTSIETGIYSAAVRISEVFYFVPTATTIALFPSIIRNYKQNHLTGYYEKVQSLFDVLALLAIVFCLGMTIFAYPLIVWGFGNEYAASVNVLRIHTWSSFFVFLGVASSKIMVTEQNNKYNMYCTLVGAFINLILNYLFIPKWGAIGASVATAISYFISVYACIIFKPTRQIGYFLLNCLNLWRLLKRSKELIKNFNK